MTIRSLHAGDDCDTHGAEHGAELGAARPTGSRGAPSPLPRGDGAPSSGAGRHPRAPHGACGERMDAELLIYRLEEAGATLLALPGTGWSPRLRTNQLEIVRTALEAYGWEPKRARAPVPSAAKITRMDEAFEWITLIPRERYVLRRIAGARALVSPLTERHLFSWRRLGVLLGADHKAIQRWHAEAIGLMVRALHGAG